MSTRRKRTRRWLLLATAAIAIACGTSDAHVSCSPTPTCSLRDSRFAPIEPADAGPRACDVSRRRCAAQQVSAGRAHACALALAGEVLCWGDDSLHQLGTRLPDADPPDAAVVGDAGVDLQHFVEVLHDVKQVAAGGDHTCALGEDGAVRCWGENAQGQVDGSTGSEPSATPGRVRVPSASQIAAGAAHSCAVVPEGVSCWGSARYGQAGRKISELPLAPGVIPETQGAVEVAAGVRHTCARFASGSVSCWGELLDPTSGEPRSTPNPVPVADLDDATAIAAGAGHSCALHKNGRASCWGNNDSGQLGDGSTQASVVPVLVPLLASTLHLAAGGMELEGRLIGHTCIADTNFQVWCWGNNAQGQLGIGAKGASATSAQEVLGREEQEDSYLADVAQLALGGTFSCALDHDGPVTCWGDDSLGQLGHAHDEMVRFGRATRVARFGGGR